ncbi:MAG: peptidoglycan editing factor PgeF [Betaproteobacteria bacterium]|nr:peptidoglycan editing factor PgeF [Betaproteobacteria bacterium]
MATELIIPDWPAPANVGALQTTRAGGVSGGPWAAFNLGDHVGDDPQAVRANRARLRAVLPAEPVWLRQVHGAVAVDAAGAGKTVPEADAAFASVPGVVCAVLTADCLPVLFCDLAGTIVGAVHAGWRGLRAGVLENTVAALRRPPGEIMAWLGPAIGRSAFEVGSEVRAAFVADDPGAAAAFAPGVADRWWCDLPALARRRLAARGVTAVFGGDACTVSDPERYFSYRRDGVTGRMASLVWLDRPASGV